MHLWLYIVLHSSLDTHPPSKKSWLRHLPRRYPSCARLLSTFAWVYDTRFGDIRTITQRYVLQIYMCVCVCKEKEKKSKKVCVISARIYGRTRFLAATGFHFMYCFFYCLSTVARVYSNSDDTQLVRKRNSKACFFCRKLLPHNVKKDGN